YAVRGARPVGGGKIENNRRNFLHAIPARFSDVSLLRCLFSVEQVTAVFAVADLGPSAHIHRFSHANADPRHSASASKLHRDYYLAGSSCPLVQASHEPSPDQVILSKMTLHLAFGTYQAAEKVESCDCRGAPRSASAIARSLKKSSPVLQRIDDIRAVIWGCE